MAGALSRILRRDGAASTVDAPAEADGDARTVTHGTVEAPAGADVRTVTHGTVAAPAEADGDAPTATHGAVAVAATVIAPPREAPSGPAPTRVEPAPAPEGEAIDAAAPGFRHRGALRRRLRFTRRAREIALRDLGGLVFELHRFGRDRGDLVEAKLTTLGALDAEMRTLETVLDERREVTVLREPGLGACPRCGALHGSDAAFCSACGLALTPAAGLPAAVAVSPEPPAPDPGAPPGP